VAIRDGVAPLAAKREIQRMPLEKECGFSRAKYRGFPAIAQAFWPGNTDRQSRL